MPNLVQDLGALYVTDNFHQAAFMYDGKICSFYQSETTNSSADSYNITGEDYEDPKRIRIPNDAIKNFSFFQYPKLGYRNVKQTHPDILPSVVYIALKRSTKRGLHMNNLIAETVTLQINERHGSWDYLNLLPKLRTIFNPQYPTFGEALAELVAGRSTGAALSPDVAVLLATDRSPESEFVIMFRGRVVGTVTPEGGIELSNKAARRGSITTLLEM